MNCYYEVENEQDNKNQIQNRGMKLQFSEINK